ncbi:MAG: orotidine-5'-phosphate decarboxylase [Candidatus Pacebacteria bacterium]|nr:orotidine-5'-phosphate decarboxylase [Candidatus Paceibacterota bacterium]MBP9840433.1 orotidine-5'-phosphate decarboxylase [Candidatus Paceibacterota bacterium]
MTESTRVFRLHESAFLALDGMSLGTAISVASDNKERFLGVKVNDALIGEVGATTLIEILKEYGHVFADPKLHDIPNTVANSVAKFTRAGASLITVHTTGGREMMRAAVKAFDDNGGTDFGILGVTVPTSLSDRQCVEMYGMRRLEKVLQLAGFALESGLWGVVCAANEVREISEKFPDLRTVVPGTRLPGGNAHDQKNIETTLFAYESGATVTIIGRDYLSHANPQERYLEYRKHLGDL